VKPLAPVVGVGGVVVRDGRALLVRRGKPPLYGRWVVPGGRVELGETLEAALVREIREETGLDVEPVEVLTVFDRIERDGDEVAYHYVIVDYLCRWRSGEAAAASDALDAAWVGREEIAGYDVPPKAVEVVEDALRRAARGWTGGPGALRAARAGPILGPVSTGDPEGT
jgi:ADP-ribose pyrophosphatase YjhB (NUDIX family)